MDPIVSSIVAAVTAGAVAASKDVASGAVKDAYNGLKTILTDTYKAAFFPSLEKNPDSKNARGSAAEEIEDSDAQKDAKVIEAAAKVIEEIEKHTALHSALEEGGIVVKNLSSERSIILGKIKAERGVVVDNLKAGHDIKIDEITSGNSGN